MFVNNGKLFVLLMRGRAWCHRAVGGVWLRHILYACWSLRVVMMRRIILEPVDGTLSGVH